MSVSVAALMVLSAAAMSATQPGGYPVQTAWFEHQQFCANASPTSVGWTEFTVEPESTLDYLTESSPFLPREAQPAAPRVYRKSVEGREFFAFKTATSHSVHCRLYDFAAAEPLDETRWSAAIGLPLSVRSSSSNQRFDWQNSVSGQIGMVELRMSGYLTNADDVGFIGLNLVTVSEEKL